MDKLLETIVETLVNHGSAIKGLYVIVVLNSIGLGILALTITLRMLS